MVWRYLKVGVCRLISWYFMPWSLQWLLIDALESIVTTEWSSCHLLCLLSDRTHRDQKVHDNGQVCLNEDERRPSKVVFVISNTPEVSPARQQAINEEVEYHPQTNEIDYHLQTNTIHASPVSLEMIGSNVDPDDPVAVWRCSCWFCFIALPSIFSWLPLILVDVIVHQKSSRSYCKSVRWILFAEFPTHYGYIITNASNSK